MVVLANGAAKNCEADRRAVLRDEGIGGAKDHQSRAWAVVAETGTVPSVYVTLNLRAELTHRAYVANLVGALLHAIFLRVSHV